MSRERRKPSNRVLVDSSAYFALLNRRDVSHEAMEVLGKRLLAGRWQQFTTSFILAETHALLLNRVNRHLATVVNP
jgi:predicted nucleic acid-binding protein